MILGASTLFAIDGSFKRLVEYMERWSGEIRVWEIIDEGCTSLTRAKESSIKELARSFDLKLSLHAPFLDVNIASLSAYMRRASIKHLSKSLLKAFRLECRVYVIHGGSYPHINVKGRAYRRAVKAIRELATIAEDLDIKLAVENSSLSSSQLFTEADEALSLLREVASEAVGLCLDVGHANIARQLDNFLEDCSKMIVHVHAHDNDGVSDLHLTPGRGIINWPKLIKKLREKGFEGALIVETEEDPLEGYRVLKGLIQS